MTPRITVNKVENRVSQVDVLTLKFGNSPCRKARTGSRTINSIFLMQEITSDQNFRAPSLNLCKVKRV